MPTNIPPIWDLPPEQLNGLLAQEQDPNAPWQPPVAPEPEHRGFLDRLFGSGVPEGLIADGQRKPLQRNALMQAGLAALKNASTSGSSAVGGIAAALEGGQQGYQQGAQGQLAVQQRDLAAQKAKLRADVMAKYAGKNDPDSMKQMLQDLVRIGDYEGARSLSEYLKSQGNQGKRKIMQVKVPGTNAIQLMDGDTGEIIDTVGDGSATPAISKYQQELLDRKDATIGNRAVDQISDDFDRETKDRWEAVSAYAQLRRAAEDGGSVSSVPIIDLFARIHNPRMAVRVGMMNILDEKMGNLAQKLHKKITMLTEGEIPDDLRREILKTAFSSVQEQVKQITYARKKALVRAKNAGAFGMEDVLRDPTEEFPELAKDFEWKSATDNASDGAARARAALGKP